MRQNLRITAKFDPVISERINANTGQTKPILTEATIVDDAANLLHQVKIEYDVDDDDNIYRRLNYTMVHMANMKKVISVTNVEAQELLYKIATALTGSTLVVFDPESNSYKNRNFDKSMLILGLNDGTWDPVLPNDVKPKRKSSVKKDDGKDDGEK